MKPTLTTVQSNRLADLPPPPGNKVGWPWTVESPQAPAGSPGGAPWPKISIVTPSYNQGQFIEETIRSVLLQGYPNLEYIVMDGGSTDDSIEIIRKYEPWIDFLHIGPDGGQAAAIAEGFRRATGDILAWINSDDRYRPGAFERVAKFSLTHPKIVFGNGDVNYIDANGQFMGRIYAVAPNWFLTANLGIHSWPQQGCFWRRSAYEAVGGVDSAFRFCMDRDLFIRLTKSGSSRRIPGAPLADFRVHDSAKSSTILDVAAQEGQLLIERYGHDRVRQHKALLRWLWWLWCKLTNLRFHLKQDLRKLKLTR